MLSDADRALLTFEAGRWIRQGAKDEAALKQFGLTPVAYAQRLLVLLDNPAAYEADPVLIKRLRRLRDTRRARRCG